MKKVTRTKNIYSMKKRKSKKALRFILIFLLAAVLLLFGYSIAGPVMNFVSGKYKPAASSSSSLISSQSDQSQSSQPSSQITVSDSIKGFYLPKNYIGDLNALSNVITGAKQAGFNLAVLDLKGEDGILNYNSKVNIAVTNKLTAANAPDAAPAAAVLSKAGITPAARICCFEDASAPSAVRDFSVKFSEGDHSTRWVDGFNKYWLNPYNADAQQYIIDIAKEAVANGFKYIILDGVLFPYTGGLDKAWFSDSKISKEEQLRVFIANAKQQINAAGGKVIIHFISAASIGQASPLTGQNQNIFGFDSDYISPDLSPSGFGANAVMISGKTIIRPDLTPASTVAAAASYVGTQAGENKKGMTVPFLQAYTNTSLGSGFYKNYTGADINGEVASVKASGINSFILFNPSGSYDFTSLSVK